MSAFQRHALWFFFCWASSVAGASGLQVSPVSLTLLPTQNAEGLWLSNTSDGVVNAQVRVYRWTQVGGQEQLKLSRGLLVSPPMLQVPAAGRQLIRVIRSGAPPSGAQAAQEAYRLVIDELPLDTPGRKGLQFVLSYSLPVFVQPAGAPPSAPQLGWALRQEAGKAVLEVANTGGSHAQLAALHFIDSAGASTAVHPGLLGYVLPGAQMRWELKPSPARFAAGGHWEAMVNGQTVQPPIQTFASPR